MDPFPLSDRVVGAAREIHPSHRETQELADAIPAFGCRITALSVSKSAWAELERPADPPAERFRLRPNSAEHEAQGDNKHRHGNHPVEHLPGARRGKEASE